MDKYASDRGLDALRYVAELARQRESEFAKYRPNELGLFICEDPVEHVPGIWVTHTDTDTHTYLNGVGPGKTSTLEETFSEINTIHCNYCGKAVMTAYGDHDEKHRVYCNFECEFAALEKMTVRKRKVPVPPCIVVLPCSDL